MRSVDAIVPPKASTVVLTGAGFSVNAGLPVTKCLVRRGRERLKALKNAEFIDVLDSRAGEVLEEAIGEDIEAVLTRLRVLKLYSQKHDYLRDIFPLEMGIYFLVWTALRLSSDPPPLYDAFLGHLGNDVAVATLNYDLVLEAVFRRQHRAWHYPLQGEANFHDELRVPRDDDPQSIPYLKLHGSFNWHHCWRCGYFRIVRDEWFSVFYLPRQGRHPLLVGSRGILLCDEDECVIESGPEAGQAELKPLIIPPARLKEYSQAPLYRQWAFFDLLLAQAQQLMLVGTSIRDDDVLLFNSLSLLRLKNPQLKRLVVINSDEAIATKARTLTEVDAKWYPCLEAYLADE